MGFSTSTLQILNLLINGSIVALRMSDDVFDVMSIPMLVSDYCSMYSVSWLVFVLSLGIPASRSLGQKMQYTWPFLEGRHSDALMLGTLKGYQLPDILNFCKESIGLINELLQLV